MSSDFACDKLRRTLCPEWICCTAAWGQSRWSIWAFSALDRPEFESFEYVCDPELTSKMKQRHPESESERKRKTSRTKQHLHRLNKRQNRRNNAILRGWNKRHSNRTTPSERKEEQWSGQSNHKDKSIKHCKSTACFKLLRGRVMTVKSREI